MDETMLKNLVGKISGQGENVLTTNLPLVVSTQTFETKFIISSKMNYKYFLFASATSTHKPVSSKAFETSDSEGNWLTSISTLLLTGNCWS